MTRYCTNCRKDYEFDPKEVSGQKEIKCPVCGNMLSAYTRNPKKVYAERQADIAVSNGLARVFHFFWIFYMVMGLIGLGFFLAGMSTALHIVTVISLVIYVIQLLTGTIIFASGVYLLPLGAAAGFLFFKSIDGACLGVHVVFLIRHIVREILWKLLYWFIGKLQNGFK